MKTNKQNEAISIVRQRSTSHHNGKNYNWRLFVILTGHFFNEVIIFTNFVIFFIENLNAITESLQNSK